MVLNKNLHLARILLIIGDVITVLIGIVSAVLTRQWLGHLILEPLIPSLDWFYGKRLSIHSLVS